ncbi:MAG TPA: SRPBCC family protein [Caulobacteraceae bacterium]|nr:SRPBCC family protein [Caulobacteraceae bacterium]
MTQRSVSHGSFTVERTYDAPPARVFHALSDKAAKQAWFHGPPGWTRHAHTLDFRVGGKEYSSGGPEGGTAHIYDATFMDIVPNERIITAYEMFFDETKISVSLAIFELKPQGAGTRLTLTEHGAFLDGYDDAGSRKQGTEHLMDALGAAVHEPARL